MSRAWVSAICSAAFKLAALDHFCDAGSRRYVLAHLHGSGQGSKRTGNAGSDLQFLRLFLVEIEQCLRLVDLGLLRSELDLDRLLIHVELLLAELMLYRQLVGGALRLLVGQARDDAEVVKRLISLGLQLILRIVGIHLRRSGFLVHQCAFKRGLKALVVSLRSLQLQPGIEYFLIELRIGQIHDDRVWSDLGSGQDANAHHGRVGLGRNQFD